jgi:hypothetical protein
MFSVRVKKADSWLDPESAGILGWKLAKRLEARCEGQEGRFLTLTYDPKQWGSAQECFDRARADKHVSRFMRKLGALLAVDLKGKWLCKMEFQASGFVHWHILLLGVGFINPVQFNRIFSIWGKGSVNVKPLTPQNIRYLTKYVAKDGMVPGWIYAYPARSVKVVRPSEGFWNDDQAAKARERTAKRKAEGEQVEKSKEEFYEPIGTKLKREKTLFRAGEKFFSVEAAAWRVREVLRRVCGVGAFREERGWRVYDVPGHCLKYVLEALGVTAAATNAPRRPSGKGAAERIGEGRVPLFLIGTGKRAGWWKVKWWGKWFTLSPADIAGKWRQWWLENGPWWEALEDEQARRYAWGVE